MEDPQEDLPVAPFFCVCGGSVLLGDLGGSRSMEREFVCPVLP